MSKGTTIVEAMEANGAMAAERKSLPTNDGRRINGVGGRYHPETAAWIPFNNDDLPHKPSEELLLSYIPSTTKHIVSFSGIGVLKPGYIMTIVGPSGFGKSSVTESVIASALNPYVDCLGIKVSLLPCGSTILWIDGERIKDDIALGFDRIKRRIQIDNNLELIENERFKGVHCHPFITYPSRSARIKELERLIIDIHPRLVVLDGAADFVRDVNDTPECVDFISLLTALANEHGFGVITSIHPNPGGQSDYKPRGVLGSELIRVSESILLLKRAPDNRDVRILTMDFAHGKNRNEADNLEHYFSWSNEHKMFMSCHYEAPDKPRKADKQNEVFTDLLTNKSLTYGELSSAVQQRAGIAIATAKRWITQATDRQLIFNDNGMYKLTPF